MRSGIYKIDDAFYRLRYRDLGFIHKEDRGLWRADKVEWTGTAWRIVDELNAWCPECEHRITRGCSYCPTCGVKLDWSE